MNPNPPPGPRPARRARRHRPAHPRRLRRRRRRRRLRGADPVRIRFVLHLGGSTATTGVATTTSCTEVPTETAALPTDGSNGPNVAEPERVVRSDIRSSFGSYSGTVSGTPLTMKVTVLDLDNGCKPLQAPRSTRGTATCRPLLPVLAGSDEPELVPAAVQTTDADGAVTFTTVYPARTRAVTARALRGLPEPVRRDERGHQARHVADGHARGREHTVYELSGYESERRGTSPRRHSPRHGLPRRRVATDDDGDRHAVVGPDLDADHRRQRRGQLSGRADRRDATGAARATPPICTANGMTSVKSGARS